MPTLVDALLAWSFARGYVCIHPSSVVGCRALQSGRIVSSSPHRSPRVLWVPGISAECTREARHDANTLATPQLHPSSSHCGRLETNADDKVSEPIFPYMTSMGAWKSKQPTVENLPSSTNSSSPLTRPPLMHLSSQTTSTTLRHSSTLSHERFFLPPDPILNKLAHLSPAVCEHQSIYSSNFRSIPGGGTSSRLVTRKLCFRLEQQKSLYLHGPRAPWAPCWPANPMPEAA
jgi:hypothetical protein